MLIAMPSRYFRYLALIPKKVYYIGIFAAFMAVLSVLIEYAIASLIQVYTFYLHFIHLDQIPPALIMLTRDVWDFFLIFISSLILRAICQFFLIYINIAFIETFIFESRKQVFSIIFNTQEANCFLDLGHTSNLLGEVIPKAGNFVTGFSRFVVLLIQLIGLGIFCLYALPKEFLTSIVTFILIAPIIYLLNKRARRYGSDLLEKSNYLNRQIMATVKNLVFIKILGMEKVEEQKMTKVALDYYQGYLENNKFYSVSQILPTTFGIIIVFCLFYFFNVGGSSGAKLMTLFYLLYRFIQVLGELVGVTNGLNMYQASFLLAMEIMEKNFVQNKIVKNKLLSLNHSEVHEFNLDVQNISFYFDNKKPVFQNISFRLASKECLVVKGASGTGKSTLIMTLIGVYTPNQGQVIWGKHNLDKLDPSKFRLNIGYIGPEPYIIRGTIRDNLLYGLATEPSEFDIERALMISDMLLFLSELPRGLLSQLSEQGEGLSMGQKQRLGLARAILRKPKILVLDEITANLDRATEEIIVANISKLKSEMTLLIATHSSAFDPLADIMINLNQLK